MANIKLSAIVALAALLFLGGGSSAQAVSGPSASGKTAVTSAELPKTLRKAVEDAIRSQTPQWVSEWKITGYAVAGVEAIPPGLDGFRLVPGKSQAKAGSLYFSAELLGGGEVVKRLGVSCRLEMYADVAVARGKIPRETVITDEMVEIARVRVEKGIGDYYQSAPEVVGLVAEREIQDGRAVLRDLVGRAMDVKEGDIVTITAQTGAVQLTARGVAKKNGTIGEVIPVVNLRSNKKLSARIVDGQTVSVAF